MRASSGTRKAETGARPPPGALSRSWEAKRTTYFENGVPELVMNCLAPSMTQSVPSRRARVPMLPASDPPVGSVSPKAQKVSPEAMPGRYSARRSSEARWWNSAAEMAWTCTVTASEESTTANSSAAMHMLRRSAPAPP